MNKRKIISFLLISFICSLTICSLASAQPPWLKKSYFQNFSGLNDNLFATEIQDNEASDLQNVVFDTGGAIKKRYGYVTIPQEPITKVMSGTTVKVTGLTFYEEDDGTRHVVGVAVSDTKATVFEKTYNVGGGLPEGAWTDASNAGLLPQTGYTVNDLADFAVAENTLVITLDATSQIKPFKYDKDTGYAEIFTTDADCPVATLVEYHKNHLFLSGNSTYPSRVYYSALDDITDYTATDFFDVATSDGTQVRGLVSTLGSLYIFKDRSIWRLSGTNKDDYILAKMVDNIGTLSQQSIAIVNNFIYFTTAQNDIAVYDGGYAVRFISQKIRNTIGGLNFSRATGALGIGFSSYKYNDYDYYGSVSTAGSSNNDRVLLFDTFHNAWSKFKGIDANAWCVGEDSAGKNILIFGDYDGYVHSYPSTDFYDGDVNVTAIDANYQTKWFKYEDLSLGDKYWRLLKTYTLSETQETYLTIDAKSDYEISGKTVIINLEESGDLWDVAEWDDFLWSGQSLVIDRAEINKGKFMFQINYSNNNVSEGFTIIGFEIFIEPTLRI